MLLLFGRPRFTPPDGEIPEEAVDDAVDDDEDGVLMPLLCAPPAVPFWFSVVDISVTPCTRECSGLSFFRGGFFFLLSIGESATRMGIYFKPLNRKIGEIVIQGSLSVVDDFVTCRIRVILSSLRQP